MPSGPGARLTVEVLRLTPGDVARGAKELVEFEATAAATWRQASEDRKQAALTLVRAALVRLLQNDGWVPGSVRVDGSRIDVHLTIEMDFDIDTIESLVNEQLTADKRQARDRLVALLAELEVDDATAP